MGHSNTRRPELMKKPKWILPGHDCTCNICGDHFNGHGITCPNCILDNEGEWKLNIAINNAILETRIQSQKTRRTE